MELTNHSSSANQNLVKLFIAICIFSVPAFSLTVNSGYSYGSALLLILAIFMWLLPKETSIRLDITDGWLIFAFCFYFFSFFISICLDGYHFRELDRPSRFIFAALILVLLKRYVINYTWLLYGCGVGAIGGGIFALYESIVLDAGRPNGHQNAISFGNDSMLLGLLSFSIFFHFITKNKKILAAFFLCAAIFGITASFLSGSRGGWIALPLIFLIIYLYKSIFSKNGLIFLIATTLLSITAISYLPQTQRIKTAYQNILLYSQGLAKETSTGVRLELWKSSYYAFLEAPIFGIGKYNNKKTKEKQIANQLVHPIVLKFTHAHNEFLNSLGQRGLWGFTSLMLIFLIPLLTFAKYLLQKDKKINIFPLCGLITGISYIIFCLTQASFSHNNGVVMYSVLTVFFWQSSKQALNSGA